MLVACTGPEYEIRLPNSYALVRTSAIQVHIANATGGIATQLPTPDATVDRYQVSGNYVIVELSSLGRTQHWYCIIDTRVPDTVADLLPIADLVRTAEELEIAINLVNVP